MRTYEEMYLKISKTFFFTNIEICITKYSVFVNMKNSEDFNCFTIRNFLNYWLFHLKKKLFFIK